MYEYYMYVHSGLPSIPDTHIIRGVSMAAAGGDCMQWQSTKGAQKDNF